MRCTCGIKSPLSMPGLVHILICPHLPRLCQTLQGVGSYDPDIRCMAITDLIRKFEKKAEIEQTQQVPVRDAMLKLIEEDKSSDVKTATVKFMSDMAEKFNPENVSYIMEKLGRVLVTCDPESKASDSSRADIADGIKSIYEAVDAKQGALMTMKMVEHLTKGIDRRVMKDDTEIDMVLLDVLKAVLTKCGVAAIDHNKKILASLERLLESKSTSVRARAGSCMGPLVRNLSDEDFKSLMNTIVAKIAVSDYKDTYIGAIKSICSFAGVRMGDYLDDVVPQLISFCQGGADELDEAKLDLWENCLQALTFVISECPNKVSAYLSSILPLGLRLIKHDPNFVGDSDMQVDDNDGDAWGDAPADDGWGAEAGGDDGWGDDGDVAMGEGGGGFGDGGGDWGSAAAYVPQTSADETWKVRRAAVNMLSTFIREKSDILKDHWEVICRELVSRIPENNVSVKEAILFTLRDLLREGYVWSSAEEAQDQAMDIPKFVRTRSAGAIVSANLPLIVTGILDEFNRSPETRTRKALFSVAAEVEVTTQGGLSSSAIADLSTHTIKAIEATGTEADANINALKFLLLLFRHHSIAELGQYAGEFTASTIKCVGICASNDQPQALGVLGAAVSMISGQRGMSSLIKGAFNATYKLMEQKDVPEAVKIAAISTMGCIVALNPGSVDVKKVIDIYGERLANETTRLPTLNAITEICTVEGKVADLSSLVQSLPEIVSFLRKEPQSLRHTTASTLEAFVTSQRENLTDEDFRVLLGEISQTQITPHISDKDLLLAGAVLDLISSCISAKPTSTALIATAINGMALDLVRSPLLQGKALKSLISYFQAALVAKQKTLQFAAQESSLLNIVDSKTNKEVVHNVARCISGLITQAKPATRKKSIANLVKAIKSKSKQHHYKQLSVLAIGDIGSSCDLSVFGGLSGSELRSTVLTLFDSETENVRSAAAWALGNLAVGNMDAYLPVVLKQIEDRPYLSLVALKECVVAHLSSRSQMQDFFNHIDQVFPVAYKMAEAKEQGVRSVSAEILGRLSVINPTHVLPKIVDLCTSPSIYTRTAAAAALRFALHPHMDYTTLSQYYPQMLNLLNDADINVVREMVISFTLLVETKADICDRDVLAQTLQCLYGELKIKKKLIREVDYAAFKMKVDDGLPLRKAAYNCLSSILVNCTKTIDLKLFLKHVRNGIADQDQDIAVLALEIMKATSRLSPSSLLEVLDEMGPIFMTCLKLNVKAAKAKDTAKKANEALKAVVRAARVFASLPGSEMCNVFIRFNAMLHQTPQLSSVIKEVEEEED